MIGKTLDEKYRIDRLLGSGGMGSVYGAEDVRTGQEVAVKVIHAHLPGQSIANLQRFTREAQAAGSVDTEHIVRCLDAGTDPETQSPYMVLELLRGEDFQRVLRRLGPLDPALALRVTAQTCLGLSSAHEAKIIHRDIKPANIFLSEREGGERLVKVLDFGVAKIRRDAADNSSSSNLTQTGSILGSPLYMSPEQARSVKNVDERADVWSVGVVLYQALAGRTPFNHIAGLGDLLIALSSEPPPPVQQFAPWVSPEIAALLDRALRIDVRERFQSAGEMFEALSAMLPEGITIHESMLVRLPAEQRERTASTYFRRIDTAQRPQARAFDHDGAASAPRPRAASAFDHDGIASSPGPRTAPAVDDSAPSQDTPAGAVSGSSTRDGTAATVAAVSQAGAQVVVNGGSNPPTQPTQGGMSSTSPSVEAFQPGARKPFPRAGIVIACAALAAGAVGAYMLGARSGPGPLPEPAASAAAILSATSSPPRVEPAPTTAATQAPSSAPDLVPSVTATAPSARSTQPVPSASPSARPKASAAPSVSASAAPTAPATAPPSSGSFTDFGDRK